MPKNMSFYRNLKQEYVSFYLECHICMFIYLLITLIRAGCIILIFADIEASFYNFNRSQN